MPYGFNFDGLFVLDLANNHQGDVEHGLNIIRQHGAVMNKHGVRGAIKFQFRQLDSFVHPAHKEGSDNKHIPRFLSTRLNDDQFRTLLAAVSEQDLTAICTPFDEDSVDVIVDMGFDVLKVASCSATDWPLLEKMAAAGLPVIFSTGGLNISDIDNLVSFFEHRAVDFAIMHCVSVYPTPDELCNLANIAMLRERYPGITIGWSTHEKPSDTAPVMVALGQGAGMLERHVGINTEAYKLNAYSSTPDEVDAWITAAVKARTLLGESARQAATAIEAESIRGLSRGVFARRRIKAGEEVSRNDVFFAMPCVEGQLTSGQWRSGIMANHDLVDNESLMINQLTLPPKPAAAALKAAVHDIKAMLNIARIDLGAEFEVEFSHHYGVERFREIGTVIITCINREYCKKILVQLPGQKHPAHYHKRKEETFQVLWGTLETSVDGRNRTLRPGDTSLVLPGVWHSFASETGCIFEEVSTTHYNNDSVYRDSAINEKAREERKTIVDHWGRFQVGEA